MKPQHALTTGTIKAVPPILDKKVFTAHGGPFNGQTLTVSCAQRTIKFRANGQHGYYAIVSPTIMTWIALDDKPCTPNTGT